MLLCNSCLKGIGWEEEQNSGDPTTDIVPGLILTATPSTIIADGEDVSLLEVKYNGQVVNEGFTLYDGDDQVVVLENMEFRTTTAGEYKFWVDYKAQQSEVIITAEEPTPDAPNTPAPPVDENPENLNFKRRALMIQFTGTGCGYCPGMTNALHIVMEDEFIAEHTVLTAAHRYNSNDPAYLAGYALDQAMGVSGYPSLVVDMYYITGYYQYIDYIKEMVTTSLERTSVKAGIAATSIVEDDQVIITATVKAAEETKLRIGAWLIEDGIYGQQSNYGVAEGDFNTHDNCIRVADSKVATTDYTGHAIGPVDEDGNVQAIKKGETAEYTFTIDLKDKWVREKCSIVIFVTAPERVQNQEYFFVNNVIEIPLEGEVAFEYVDDSAADKAAE